jgi:hypothetical protein
MIRDSVQTVTFPVLTVAESIEKSDGWGTFLGPEYFNEADDASMLIHVVTMEDVKKWLRTGFDSKDSALFVGSSQLKRAYDLHDEFNLHRAYEKLRPHVPNLMSPDNFELSYRQRDGRIGSVSIVKKWSTTRWNYSQIMTGMFEGVRLVMWYSQEGNRFIPALFCPDRKSAAFTMTFTGRIRLCPKCDAPFIPAAGNVDYCCIAHREAHRVARSRWRAKQKADGKKEK